MKTPITIALSEVKIIGKRIEEKKGFILSFLVRPEFQRDPLAKDKGSEAALARELQAIRDLELRLIKIRREIQKANQSTSLTVEGVTRSVSDWLTWKREVAPTEQALLRSMQAKIDQARQQAMRQGGSLASSNNDTKQGDFIVNVSESELAKSIEDFEKVYGSLDGALSLVNATTTIDLE